VAEAKLRPLVMFEPVGAVAAGKFIRLMVLPPLSAVDVLVGLRLIPCIANPARAVLVLVMLMLCALVAVAAE